MGLLLCSVKSLNHSLSQLTVTKQASTGAFVETNKSQVLDDPECRAFRRSFGRLGQLALDLESNLDNLKWVREDLWDVYLAFVFPQVLINKNRGTVSSTHHLTSAGRTARKNFRRPPYVSGLWIREFTPD
jgi:hypothetical protein